MVEVLSWGSCHTSRMKEKRKHIVVLFIISCLFSFSWLYAQEIREEIISPINYYLDYPTLSRTSNENQLLAQLSYEISPDADFSPYTTTLGFSFSIDGLCSITCPGD
ncbi:MAG: hypothetical protein KAG99_09530, partial [Bacteroidales bacterium]|nr:hypothetical protein [Bacteroidales bacterium]